MRVARLLSIVVATIASAVVAVSASFAQTDPLPTWNGGADKKAIVEFVQAMTTGSPQFVPPRRSRPAAAARAW